MAGLEQVPESAVVVFHHGLPGVDSRRFVILKPDGLEPIVVLQSLDDPSIGLPAIPCASVVPDYAIEFGEDDRDGLELDEDDLESKLVYLAVLLVDAHEEGPCCNLAAPIVINPTNNRGRQITRLNNKYAAMHPIAEG